MLIQFWSATNILECLSQVVPEGKYLIIEDSVVGLKIIAAKTDQQVFGELRDIRTSNFILI